LKQVGGGRRGERDRRGRRRINKRIRNEEEEKRKATYANSR